MNGMNLPVYRYDRKFFLISFEIRRGIPSNVEKNIYKRFTESLPNPNLVRCFMKLITFSYSSGIYDHVTFWFSEGWPAEETKKVTAYFKKYEFGGSLFTENLYALLWLIETSEQEVELLTNTDGEISGFTFDLEGSPVSLLFEPFVRLACEGYDDPASDNLVGADEIATRLFRSKYAKDVCPF